jgi:hypothetical protein
MFEKGSRSFTALPKNEFFDGMKEDLEKVYLNSSQISRILANLDESLLAEVEKVIGWVDWLSPTSQFPFDTTLGTTGVEYLVRHEHYKKALEVIDKIVRNASSPRHLPLPSRLSRMQQLMTRSRITYLNRSPRCTH